MEFANARVLCLLCLLWLLLSCCVQASGRETIVHAAPGGCPRVQPGLSYLLPPPPPGKCRILLHLHHLFLRSHPSPHPDKFRVELDFPPKDLLSLRKRVSAEWKSPRREVIEKVIKGFTFSMVVAHCASSSIALRKLCSSCGMREDGGVEKLRPSYFATEGIEKGNG